MAEVDTAATGNVRGGGTFSQHEISAMEKYRALIETSWW